MNFGIVLFPAFQALDAFGPLDALNNLSLRYPLKLSIIAPSLDPVSTKPRSQANNPRGSDFSQSIVPTHDFNNAPPLDVLIVPGGLGTREDGIQPVIDFVAKTYPSLKYLITVCTGSSIVARAGILDGKRATSNKAVWSEVTSQAPQVNWVPHARWVVDGNVWTSAGVSAGIDITLAFIEKIYGSHVADEVTMAMEYDRHTDSSWDPFAKLHNLPETA